MIDKLDFLVRFWELRARHALLGQPLLPLEQLELLSLMQLVTSDFKVPQAGPVDRPEGALPVQLIGDGAIFPGEIRAISAAALIVASVTVVPGEARVIVRVPDAVSGVEYALPCTVSWVCPGTPHTIALVVDGIPMRSRICAPPDVPMRSTLPIGRHARIVG